jgi:hypothetical protein
MAVLVEGISVVIRVERIKGSARGGWEGFLATVPNRSLCTDGELARVGFMAREDVAAYLAQLQHAGLVHLLGGEAVDFVVVDQLRGPASRCDWVYYGISWLDDNPTKLIAVCRLRNGETDVIATPRGWSYDTSLSRNCGNVSARRARVAMKLLRQEKDCDVYWNDVTGEEVVVARTGAGRKGEGILK